MLTGWENQGYQRSAGYEGETMERDLSDKASDDFKLYLENSPHGFFLADGEGNYLVVNDAACKSTGYSQEELLGMNLIDVIYPDDRGVAADHFAHVVRDGQATGEVRFVTKDGGVRFWEVKAVKISNDRFAGFTTDITERKKAEEELSERNVELQSAFEELASGEEELKKQYQEIYGANQEIADRERKYRLLFQSSEEGIALHEMICDKQNIPIDYRFIEVNNAFERITGLSAERITGRTVKEVLPDIESFWIEKYGEVALTGNTIHFEDFSRELRRYYEVTAYCPEPGKFATLVRDISEKKLNEIQLKETNSFLENLITYASVPIIVWSPDFLITRINKAFEELTGRRAPETVGKPLAILFPPNEADRSLRLIRTTREGVRWETVEIPILHMDGSIRLVLWNSATIYDSEGSKPVATIAQGRDITTERFLEREKDAAAAQIQENITKLAILNDSIRNPLAVITTYADMALDPRLTDLIFGEVSRIDKIVGDLDKEWVASEKILEYLRKHDQVQSLNGKSTDEPGSASRGGDMNTSPLMEKRQLFIEELQAQLFTILDSIDALVYVIDMDTYDILFINREGRYLFGDPAGKKCYEWLQRGMNTPCSYCTNPLLVHHDEPTGVYKWEYYNPRVNRWFDCRDRAIRWTDGRLDRLEIATDITDRKRNEEALQKSEERFKTLVNSIQETMSVITRDGTFLFANVHAAKNLSGRDATYVIGKNIRDFVSPEKAEELINNYETTIDSGVPFVDEVMVEMQGVPRYFYNRLFPIRYGDEEQTAVLSLSLDITSQHETQESLLNSEERYRRIVDTAEEGIWQTDNRLKIVYVNKKIADMLGYSEGEMMGKNAFSFIPEEDIRTHQERIDRRKLGENDRYEQRLIKKDGTLCWFFVSANAIVNPEGTFGGSVAMFSDITERKLVEEYLKISEERFRGLFDTISSGVAIYSVIPDGSSGKDYIIEDFNRKALEIEGKKKEEVVGRSLYDLRPSIDEYGLIPIFQQVWMTGEPGFHPQKIYVDDAYTNWYENRVFRLQSGEIVAIYDDVTETKQAEEALRESEREYRDLANSIGDIFFAMDTDLRYIFWNKASEEITGIPAEQALGKTIFDLFPGEAGEKTGEIYQEVLRTKKPRTFLNPFYLNERNYIFEINVYPSERGLSVLSRDLTERTMIEDALKESTQKVLLLTRITRHDIFNELCAVRLLHDLMQESEDTEETLDLISRSLDSIGRIEQVINFTREYDDFGIAASGWLMIKRVILQARDEAPDGVISIEVEIEENLEVYSDPIIRRVFSTLIENAVRHGGQITSIRFFSHEDNDSLIIACEDDGRGIPEDEKVAIFRYGYGKNTGIGLFIATEILSITGLSIRECGNFGEGARFEILVPAGKWRFSSR